MTSYQFGDVCCVWTFDQAVCHSPMKRFLLPAQQRRIGGILHERVLEDVAGMFPRAPREDQASSVKLI
jgi:hypothetical protein